MRAAAVPPPGRPAGGALHGGGLHGGGLHGGGREEPYDEPDTDLADEAEEPAAGGSGVRAEVRRRMRADRQMRLAVLIGFSILLLGLLPAFFAVRAQQEDPAFGLLDELPVPAWANTAAVDEVSGSRWCLLECRLRERTTRSEQPAEQTAEVYREALLASGWQRWDARPCPEQKTEGEYTCWRRDELTLDLWVRPPACLAANPEAPVEPKAAAPDPEDCEGALVSMKIRDAIADERTRPRPAPQPSPTELYPDPEEEGSD